MTSQPTVSKTVIQPDLGKGAGYLAGAGVDEPAHSAGVVVRAGALKLVYCSGVVATDNLSTDVAARDTVVAPGEIKAQTRQVLRNLEAILVEEEASLRDIVRVRVFVKGPMSREMFHGIHEVRGEFFEKQHYPASTLVVVDSLVREEALIEIDADAVAF